jgi:signal transduction histidine kinase
VYVIAVPLLHGSGTVLAAVIIAGAAAAAVLLVLLIRARAATAGARDAAAGVRAAADGEISRLDAEVARLHDELRRRDAQASTRDADLAGRERRLAAAREAQVLAESACARLRSECAGLRADAAGSREQAGAIRQAVEHAMTERVPAALAGRDVSSPCPADGIGAELAGLLDEMVSTVSRLVGRQGSVRSAVVALSRRVQASAHRIQKEATLMADRHPGDADVLEVSMRVDHAAAQQARNAQSMAVLCGEWPGQQWPEPLPLVDVVQAAAGRIIAYRRIEVAGDQEAAVAAPAVEPVIHLVAELLANAAQSSPPSTMVPVTVRTVQRGAVIEINDCGVGLDDYRLGQARETASGTKATGLAELSEYPQTGLAVVGQYARRHGFRVDLSESVYGGVRAVVGIPDGLVETVEPAETATVSSATVPEARTPAPRATAGPVAPAAPSADTEAEPEADGTGYTRRLPRRQSPRHSAAETRRPQPRETRHVPRDREPPDPGQAGAWMGAFLNSASPDGEPLPGRDVPSGQDTGPAGNSRPDDNSADQQEQ